MPNSVRRNNILTEDMCGSCGNNLDAGPTPGEPYYAEGSRYSKLIGVEYGYDSPHRYDGVSENQCPFCGYREGRWSKLELFPNELENREHGPVGS